MGCDIHCFVEVEKADGGWVLMDHPLVERNYLLFGRIAGIRDKDLEFLAGVWNRNLELIAPIRGLPTDISEGTQFYLDYAKGDVHTYTWLTGKEAGKLEREFREKFSYECLFNYLFGNGVSGLPDGIGLKNTRVVIWFDN